MKNLTDEIIKSAAGEKDSKLRELIETLERNIEVSENAVKDPLAAVREEPSHKQPGATYISIGRKMQTFLKVRLEEAKIERDEMQQAVESEAFFVKILLLLLLITSVGMLLFSYRIDHG